MVFVFYLVMDSLFTFCFFEVFSLVSFELKVIARKDSSRECVDSLE